MAVDPPTSVLGFTSASSLSPQATDCFFTWANRDEQLNQTEVQYLVSIITKNVCPRKALVKGLNPWPLDYEANTLTIELIWGHFKVVVN